MGVSLDAMSGGVMSGEGEFAERLRQETITMLQPHDVMSHRRRRSGKDDEFKSE